MSYVYGTCLWFPFSSFSYLRPFLSLEITLKVSLVPGWIWLGDSTSGTRFVFLSAEMVFLIKIVLPSAKVTSWEVKSVARYARALAPSIICAVRILIKFLP